MEKIGGYWKPIILFQLMGGPRRYSEIKKAVPSITEKVLIQQLKQLEAEGLLSRKSLPVVPPHVTYELSKSGKALKPVLYEMARWAVGHSGPMRKTFSKQMKDFPL